MAFAIFSAVFLVIFYLHFALAHRAWLTIRGKQSTELDMGYVRQEDYFGQSFRQKLKHWLATLPAATNSTAGLRVYDHGQERIFVAPSVQYPGGRVEKEVLVTEGAFACGPNCDFRKELMVKGDGQIGEGTALQAIAADGPLQLGEGVTVRRWADAAGKLTIGADTAIHSRATSRTAIEFLPGAYAQSLFAPEIVTEGRNDESIALSADRRSLVQIPHGAGETPRAGDGFDPAKLFSMGGGTYLYEGNLDVTAPLHLRAPLVVHGHFSCGKESLLEGDVKAHGNITVGAASVVKGNLVADGNLVLKPDVYFQALLRAGGEMRLSFGVRGLREKLPVAAHATRVLTLESNVVINGKVSSANRVVAVSTPMAWLQPNRARA
jgi:predicted acyltransferase (DUF342 family)